MLEERLEDDERRVGVQGCGAQSVRRTVDVTAEPG